MAANPYTSKTVFTEEEQTRIYFFNEPRTKEELKEISTFISTLRLTNYVHIVEDLLFFTRQVDKQTFEEAFEKHKLIFFTEHNKCSFFTA